jgi:hypothetical protein
MRVADDQPDPAEAPGTQGAQELGPERLGLGWADAQADDLPASFSVRSHGDYRRDRDDATALTHLEIGWTCPENVESTN